jgi:hypothetical protein
MKLTFQVSSSLAEVTEILDRHIDNDDAGSGTGTGTDKTGNLTKRKRISFNVPGIALTPSEEIDNEDEEEDDDEDISQTKSETKK